MTRSVPALLLVACAEEPGAPHTDETGDPSGVLRDCAAEAGRICPLVGTGINGYNGEGHPALDTWLSNPMGIEYSPYGDPIVADWNNHKLRRLRADGTVDTVMGTAFVGDGDFELLDLSVGAPGTTVNLNHPTQQRYFPSGVLLSASWHTHKLRTWDPFTGLVRVLVGGAYGFVPEETDPPGEPQSAVGALLDQPSWVEVDAAGDVWIVDMRNERLRKLAMNAWEIETIAGSGQKGVAGAPGCESTEALEACFAWPDSMNPEPGGAIALTGDGRTVYVADTEAHVIRALDVASARIEVLAGRPGEAGDVDGPALEARFSGPRGLALDEASGTLFVADTDNHRIKAIDLASGAVTTFAGTGDPTCLEALDQPGAAICDEQATAGDGGPAVEATLYRPFAVELDLDGDLVVVDTFDHRIRVVYR